MAALLAIARKGSKGKHANDSADDAWVLLGEKEEEAGGGGLDKLTLWVEIQKQVEILREGIEDEE